jgi:hypothetical protein
MMKWLERNCDWSMILDFPTGGISVGNVDPHTERLNKELAITPDWYVFRKKKFKITSVVDFCHVIGVSDTDIEKIGYATCMLQTLINNDYFIKHRTLGATKFLNVVQGRNLEESNLWYDRVKDYKFEGWSLAGHHKENFEMTMTRIITMMDDGLICNKDWMHILGVGKLANGCVYTEMQRQIRKNQDHGNPNFTISYDVSSPFTTTAFGNLFLGYTLDRSGWTIQSGWIDGAEYLGEYVNANNEKIPAGAKAEHTFLDELRLEWDRKGLEIFDGKGHGNSRFVETEISKNLQMRDICINWEEKYTSTWDIATYAILMNHNLQVHLTGVFESQDIYDNAVAGSNLVPYGLLRFKDIIPEIFQEYRLKGKKNALTMVTRYAKDLNYLANEESQAGIQDNTLVQMPGQRAHNQKLTDRKEKEIAEKIKLQEDHAMNPEMGVIPPKSEILSKKTLKNNHNSTPVMDCFE